MNGKIVAAMPAAALLAAALPAAAQSRGNVEKIDRSRPCNGR